MHTGPMRPLLKGKFKDKNVRYFQKTLSMNEQFILEKYDKSNIAH